MVSRPEREACASRRDEPAAYDGDRDEMWTADTDQLLRSTAPAPSSHASPYRHLSTPVPTTASPPLERIRQPNLVGTAAATSDPPLQSATNTENNDAVQPPTPGAFLGQEAVTASTRDEVSRWASLTPSPPPRTWAKPTSVKRAQEDKGDDAIDPPTPGPRVGGQGTAGTREDVSRWASLTPTPPPRNLPKPTSIKRAREESDEELPMSDSDLPRATKRRRVHIDTAAGSGSQAHTESSTTAARNIASTYTTAASAAVESTQDADKESDEEYAQADASMRSVKGRAPTPGLRRSKRERKPRARSIQAVSIHPTPRRLQPVPRPRQRGKPLAALPPRVTVAFELGRDPVEVKREEEEDNVLPLLSEDSAAQGLADDEAAVAGPSQAVVRKKAKGSANGHTGRAGKKGKGKRGGR